MTGTRPDHFAGTQPRALWRAGFAAVLALAMGTGTFPAFAFGVLGPALIADLGLSRAELGLLTTVFFFVGGVGSLPAGPAVDRVGPRRVMLGSFFVIGVATTMMASASGYGWLLVGAAVAGVALATGNPTTNKLVAEQIPPGRRGVTMGVKQAGVQIGAFLTGALLAPLAMAWGWRTALLTSAAVPLAGVVASLRIVPPDSVSPASRRKETRQPLPPAVRRLAVYAALMGAGVAAVNTYLPLYAVERLRFSLAGAGALAATIGLVGIVSRIAWAWASERMPSYRLPLVVMGFGAAVAMAGVLVAPDVGGLLIWTAAVAFGATAVTWNAVGMLALLSEVAARDTGRASGAVLFGFYLGFVPSPLAFGGIVDATDNYRLAWAAVLLVFLMAGAIVVRHGERGRR